MSKFRVKLKRETIVLFYQHYIWRSYILLMMNDICGQIFTNNKVSHNFKEFTVSLTFQNSPKKAVQINIENN
jgi:hypothetical protein